MLVWLTGLFKCRACEARDATIASLRDEVNYLRVERTSAQTLLSRALRLETPAVRSQHEQTAPVPAGSSNWPRLRDQLERKHRKPEAPPDVEQRAEHWTNKIQDMEKAAGLQGDAQNAS